MQSQTHYQLPPEVAPFFGEINDMDGHDNLPLNHWIDEYGSEVKEFVQTVRSGDSAFDVDKDFDDAEINSHNVWNLKLEQAPGAFDFGRRVAVLDFVGTNRQLMYPGSLGVFAGIFYSQARDLKRYSSIGGDTKARRAYARRLAKIYNEWCVRQTRQHSRLHTVALLIDETPEEMYTTAKDLINKGVRGFWFAVDEPPGGVSPAHPAHDPLWALLAETRTPVLAHIGMQDGVLQTWDWREAPAFKGWMEFSEASFDPFTKATFHIAVQIFLSTMITGGVFERHPNLRFGSSEFGGMWVGPLCELLDYWHGVHHPLAKDRKLLSMKPSDYIRRNVRVSCMHREPVGLYISRYGLEDVFCYGSDYPHHEGGKTPIEDFTRSLSGHSPDVLRKFFVDNAKEVLAG